MQQAVLAGVAEAVQAAELMSRIVSMWEAQLKKERTQRDAHAERQERQRGAHVVPTKRKRPKDPSCPACQGKHRAHTCKK